MEKLKKMIEDVMVAITFAEAGEFDEDAPGPTNTQRWRQILLQVCEQLTVFNLKDEYGTQPIGIVEFKNLVHIKTAMPTLVMHAVDTITFASRRVRRCMECQGLLLEPSDYGVCKECEIEVTRDSDI